MKKKIVLPPPPPPPQQARISVLLSLKYVDSYDWDVFVSYYYNATFGQPVGGGAIGGVTYWFILWLYMARLGRLGKSIILPTAPFASRYMMDKANLNCGLWGYRDRGRCGTYSCHCDGWRFLVCETRCNL